MVVAAQVLIPPGTFSWPVGAGDDPPDCSVCYLVPWEQSWSVLVSAPAGLP